MAHGFQQGQGRFANGQPVVYRQNPAEVSAAVAHSEAAARSQAEERDRRLREAQAAEDAFVKIAMQVHLICIQCLVGRQLLCGTMLSRVVSQHCLRQVGGGLTAVG